MRLLLVIAVLLGSVSAALADRRVALIVANQNYPAAPLINPLTDASIVEPSLKSLGFQVTTVLDADLEAFDIALTQFESDAAEADVALFYYAGHGFAMNEPNDLNAYNYLMAVDADITSGSQRKLKAGGIRLDDVIVSISRAAKVALFFIDACRNDPNVRAIGGGGRGMAAIDEIGNQIFVASSTRLGTTASDGEAGEGTPFARAFAKYIGTPGRRIDDAFIDMRKEVERESGNKQRPDIVREDLDEPLILLASTGGTTTPEVTQPVRRHACADKVTLGAELSKILLADLAGNVRLCEQATREFRGDSQYAGLLDAAKEQQLARKALFSNAPEDSQLYLSTYPGGSYTDAVRRHVSSLLGL